MKRPRFTIASILVVVVLVAVGLAALRAATDAWDVGLFGITVLILLTAVLGAVHRPDRPRAFWLGFALFGWVYLVASLIPAIENRLPTGMGLMLLDSKMPRVNNPTGLAFIDMDSDGGVDLYVTGASGQVKPSLLKTNSTWTSQAQRRSSIAFYRGLVGSGRSSESFLRIGHSLVALLMAFGGGVISRTMVGRAAPGR
ncbi:MAG: hypothetical protein JWN86_1918 [Planctomycetota bacterium]|nr:hypothetical protein [Planctomycetota bacterium]